TQQHYYVYLAASMCLRGGALAGQGAPEEGIAQIQQGLNLYRMIGVLHAYSYFLTYLAAACRDAGRLDEGLAAVDEGLAQCETLLSRLLESQLLSLKGELLHRRGHLQAAEAHLRRAMEVAGRDQALSIGLCAATALSRLLRDQGSHDEARSVLTGVFGRFTE